MPEQSPEERIHNFKEVALGYRKEQAIAEAKRCLQCKNPPCVQGCPVGIDIPGFIKEIKQGNFQQAMEVIKQKNSLPGICGRVCPQETQCQATCVMGKKHEPIAIGRLERFVADFSAEAGEIVHRQSAISNQQSPKVAVIGSGPAGLTCAAELAKEDYKVTVFESLHEPGGVLRYGIPEFRLPNSIIEREIDQIKKSGVGIKLNVLVGKTITIKQLFADWYQAIFIASGAGLPRFMHIPGENLNGIYSANEFLTRNNLMNAYHFPQEADTPIKVGKKVAVVGGGNVAMDSARVSLRLGAEEVTIIYRRSEEEMPARREEVIHAHEEGIKFRLLTLPVRYLGEDGWVKKMRCIQMRLGEPDASGRRRPIPIPNSEFTLDIDTVVVAIGQSPNPLLLQTLPELKLTPRGTIQTDEQGRTSIPGVFAGGDIATGAATVISAMGMGKIAARSIVEYLCQKEK